MNRSGNRDPRPKMRSPKVAADAAGDHQPKIQSPKMMRDANRDPRPTTSAPGWRVDAARGPEPQIQSPKMTGDTARRSQPKNARPRSRGTSTERTSNLEPTVPPLSLPPLSLLKRDERKMKKKGAPTEERCRKEGEPFPRQRVSPGEHGRMVLSLEPKWLRSFSSPALHSSSSGS